MRETIFRGKREDNGEWIYGYLHVIDTYGHGYTGKAIQQQHGTARPFSVRVILETVEEYTGLHDGKHADGKEIYTGDICKDDKGCISVVEWNNENFCFSCRITKGGTLVEGLRFPLWQYNDCQMNGYRYLEVIGNIHDNPELINGEAGRKP